MTATSADPWGEQFPKQLRLRCSAEFQRAYDSGIYAADGYLVVNLATNGGTNARLGVVVSRKVGKAHLRQRWKRVIRDVFRRHRQELPAGLDIVVRPRRGAACDQPQIEQSFIRLVNRAARKLTDRRSSRPSPRPTPPRDPQ